MPEKIDELLPTARDIQKQARRLNGPNNMPAERLRPTLKSTS